MNRVFNSIEINSLRESLQEDVSTFFDGNEQLIYVIQEIIVKRFNKLTEENSFDVIEMPQPML